VRRLTCVSAALLLWSALLWAVLHPSLPKEDTPPLLCSNQCRDDLRLLFRRSCETASRSIYLMIYNFTDETLLRLLERKAREGTQVVVLTGDREARRLAKRLPSVDVIARTIKGRMHQKVLVVDSHLVWIGSANWTPTSLVNHSNLIVGMECPQLARSLEMSAVSRLDAPPPLFGQRSFWVGEQQIEYWQLPSDEGALDRVKELIEGADHCICIAMFTWTHPELTEAVVAAHRRGVDVEVVIDHNSARGCGRKVAKRLAEAGIAARISMGPALLHHKFLWIDERLLVTGSANWTKAAFSENDDAFIVLGEMTAKQKRKMKKIWRAIRLEAIESSR